MQRAQEKKRKQQQQREQTRRMKQFQSGNTTLGVTDPSSSSSGGFAVLQTAEDSDCSSEELQKQQANAAPETTHASASKPVAASSSSSTPGPRSFASSTSAAASSFLRVKPGNFSRLLYTNPVCLLTTSVPPEPHTSQPTPSAAPEISDAASVPPLAGAQKVAASPSSSSAAADAVDVASASAIGPAIPPQPATFIRSLPRRNVMTISWLTPTSNHGEFVCSMHAGRYSAQLLAHSAAAAGGADFVGATFVLSVPVAGMEQLVKSIGGCSGADDHARESSAPIEDKFTRLGIEPCRPGGKPIHALSDMPSVVSASSTASSHRGGKAQQQQQHRPSPQEEEAAADAEDAAGDLFAIPGCAAHLVCEVRSSCPASELPTPRVQAHNVLFCRVRRAYVQRDYWVNGNNFVPASPATPPYLTFLGSGNFAYVTNPAHATRKW